MLLLALVLSAVLLGTAAAAIMVANSRHGPAMVYAATLLVSVVLLSIALAALLGQDDIARVASLPLGIPWLGAHFRLDALSAFFLAVVNLGAASASLFALGYGTPRAAPSACCRSIRLFLAGMNLVVLADDAFTFLVAGSSCRSRPGRW